MAAEDYHDMTAGEYEEYYGLQNDAYDDEYCPERMPIQVYDDKFTFNGRRLRTKFQRELAKARELLKTSFSGG